MNTKAYIQNLHKKYNNVNMAHALSPIAEGVNRIITDSAVNYSANYSRHLLEEIISVLVAQETSTTERQLYNLLGSTSLNPLSTEVSRFAIRHQGSAKEKSYRNNVIPVASFDTSKTTFRTVIFEAGMQWQERQVAQLGVCNINAIFELAQTQKEVLDMYIDDLVLVGNGRDLRGFLNHNEVDVVTNDNNIFALIEAGNFNAVKDIFINLRESMIKNTFELVVPDTFIIPTTLYRKLKDTTSDSIQINATNVTLLAHLEETVGLKFIASKRLVEYEGDNAGIKITDSDRMRIICARLGGATKQKELMAYYNHLPFTLHPPIMEKGRIFNQSMEMGSSVFCLVDKGIMSYLDIKKQS